MSVRMSQVKRTRIHDFRPGTVGVWDREDTKLTSEEVEEEGETKVPYPLPTPMAITTALVGVPWRSVASASGAKPEVD